MKRDAMTRIDTWKALFTLGLWMLTSAPSPIAATEPATPPGEPEVRADTLIAAEEQNPSELAASRLDKARELCLQSGDTRGEIDALLRLFVVYAKAEDEANSIGSLRRALPLLEAAEDHLGVSIVHELLGESARQRGDSAAAERHFRESLRALEQLEEAGTPISIETMAMEALARIQSLGVVDMDVLEEIERLQAAQLKAAPPPAEALAPTPTPAVQPETAADRPMEGAEADELLADIGPLSGDADLGHAKAQIERALALYEKVGDPAGQGTCLLALAKICHQTEGHASATELYHRAWEVVEEAGNFFDRWLVQMAMGTSERIAGCYPEALVHFQKALESLEAIRQDKELLRFQVFSQLGHELDRTRHIGPNRASIRELWKSILPPGWYIPPLEGSLLTAMQPLIIDTFESETLAELSNTLVAMERYDEAAVYIAQARGFPNPNVLRMRDYLRQRQEPNEPQRDLDSQELLSRLLISDDQEVEALFDQLPDVDNPADLYWPTVPAQDLSQWQKMLEDARHDNDSVREVRVLLDWARAHRRRGHEAEAQELLEQALALARERDHQDLEAEALEDLGMLHLYTSRYDAAFRAFDQALSIHRRRGHKPDQARTMSNLGLAYTLVGSYEQGMSMLQEAQRLAQELGDADLEAIAAERIASIECILGRDNPKCTEEDMVQDLPPDAPYHSMFKELAEASRLDVSHHTIVKSLLGLFRLIDWQEHEGEPSQDRGRQSVDFAEESDLSFLKVLPRMDPLLEAVEQNAHTEPQIMFEEFMAMFQGM